MVFTLNALFTKPAYSVAPIIVVAVLNDAGYDKYLAIEKNVSTCNGTAQWTASNCTSLGSNGNGTALSIDRSEHYDRLFSTMFYIACLYPLACVVLEAVCFIPYRLKFRHRRDQEEMGASIEKEKYYDSTMKDATTHCWFWYWLIVIYVKGLVPGGWYFGTLWATEQQLDMFLSDTVFTIKYST